MFVVREKEMEAISKSPFPSKSLATTFYTSLTGRKIFSAKLFFPVLKNIGMP